MKRKFLLLQVEEEAFTTTPQNKNCLIKIFSMPVVWEISALHLANEKTLFNGVILKSAPYSFTKDVNRFSNFLKVLKSYFTKSYANKSISITTNGKTVQTMTDRNGSFRIVADGLHEGEIKVHTSEKDEPLKILQPYPVTFTSTESTFDVISDIDDTIIVSNTTSLLKRFLTLSFRAPHKRMTIGFSKKMFVEFKKLNARIFYVSKSESNLFGYLTTFIEHNDLPKYALFLTPYLSLKDLFFSKKSVDFKMENISFIIENSDLKNYILFGDDTQRDMEIYYEIAKAYPKRIAKIYIRQTKSKIAPHQKEKMDKLVSVGVPVKYFQSDDDVELLNYLN